VLVLLPPFTIVLYSIDLSTFSPLVRAFFFMIRYCKRGRGESATVKKCWVVKQPAVTALFSSFSLIHFCQPLCSFWTRNRRFFFSLHYWVGTFFSR
jgi:hypothetical protein